MATSYTSLLGLALPVTGELAGTWGDTVNNAITSLLDTAVAGTTTLSADSDKTLTTTTGASNEARQAIIACTGARTAIRTITAPAQSKMYAVINATTGGYAVKIVGAGPTTGVTVANGKTAVVVWNGSDFVEVSPATATTATTAANVAGGAAGSLIYQTGSGATSTLAVGTAAQVLQVNAGATAPEWVSSTGTGNVVRASSPTLTTPTLGAASATTINKVTLTAPATGSTLTIADGKTLTASNTLTFTGTDSSSVAFGTGGTVAYTSNNLSVFSATTSAQLAGVISDETGSGSLVFATSPSLTTPSIGAATGTSLAATGGTVLVRAAATQDGVQLQGRAGGTSSYEVTITPTTLSADRTLTLADGNTTLQAGTMATTGGTLAQFAATTSAQLAGVISDETGSGSLVFATSPSLTTPTLGVATATSINKVAITAPATSATLTIADGKTFTVNNTVTLSGTDSTTMTLPGTSQTLASLAGTETLTNKRITPRVTSITSSATITPTSDTSDQYEVTALATAATIAAPSGTPTDGQKLVLRIKDNGSAWGLTWTTGSAGAFRAVGVTLPTTTVISKTVYIGCIYNTADSRWDAVAVAQEA